MLQVLVALVACGGFIAGVLTDSNPSPPFTTAPWPKEPDYFRAMEHGFQWDATHYHIHFVDCGKFMFIYKKYI